MFAAGSSAVLDFFTDASRVGSWLRSSFLIVLTLGHAFCQGVRRLLPGCQKAPAVSCEVQGVTGSLWLPAVLPGSPGAEER